MKKININTGVLVYIYPTYSPVYMALETEIQMMYKALMIFIRHCGIHKS